MARFTFRIQDDLYAHLRRFADSDGVSVNTLVNQICERFFSEGGDVSPVERRLAGLELRVAQIEASAKAAVAGSDPLVSRPASQSVSDFTW